VTVFLFQPWYSEPATFATAVIAVATVVNTIATIVYVITTVRLWRETKENVTLTRETFKNLFLPIVAVPLITAVNNEEDKEFAFNVRIENFGSVPAVELQTSAKIRADGIALAPKKHESDFLLIPPHSNIQTVFILVGDDYQKAIKCGRLDFSFAAFYEGIAENKYQYEYEGVYYPASHHFENTRARNTNVGKPEQSRYPPSKSD